MRPPWRRGRASRSSCAARAVGARRNPWREAGALEADLRSLALLGRFDRLQQLRGSEAERAREEIARKGLAPGAVLHHRVVEGLAREGNLVLGARELLLQREHVLVRLEVR